MVQFHSCYVFQSSLTRAAQYGSVQEVKELIASGEDPNPYSVSLLNHNRDHTEFCTTG